MADLTGMMQAAAGNAGGDNLFIEDVFSTFLYTGTGSAQTITNNIDLDGEGGLVWIKDRDVAYDHFLCDTERGALFQLKSNTTQQQNSRADSVTAFNSNGFNIGSYSEVGSNAEKYVAWTLRKQPKFFDIQTWSGSGSNRTIAHNLGSVPGCIMVKAYSGATANSQSWAVYHRANTANPETDYLVLNSSAATEDSNTRWNDTAPTDAVFSLGTDATVNASGNTYVAYLWAHDDGGFGDDGLQNVVTCGSFTTDGSGNLTADINLGYEPQWVLWKQTDSTGNWVIEDNMRGMPVSGDAQFLRPNTSGAEFGSSTPLRPTATGLTGGTGVGSGTFIYIAIRRGPMKTPTAGTEVFAPATHTGTGTAISLTAAGFPPDLFWSVNRNTIRNRSSHDRLRGIGFLALNLTNSEDVGYTNSLTSFNMTGISVGTDASAQTINNSSQTYAHYYFRRAPSFMDVVCYTGTGANRTVAHNLGVVPELMIMKKRSAGDNWAVYAGDNTDFLLLNTTAATADDNTYWNDTSPTSSVFSVGTNTDVNTSAATYVAYLFASLAGVQDIGTYTGNGSSLTVTTGFQPRFILVKRTSSTGNWIVGDSAKGLPAGNDPASFLNATDAETTGQDWVDVSATGFTVNETALNANVSTATYLYLAIS